MSTVVQKAECVLWYQDYGSPKKVQSMFRKKYGRSKNSPGGKEIEARSKKLKEAGWWKCSLAAEITWPNHNGFLPLGFYQEQGLHEKLREPWRPPSLQQFKKSPVRWSTPVWQLFQETDQESHRSSRSPCWELKLYFWWIWIYCIFLTSHEYNETKFIKVGRIDPEILDF